MLAHNNSIDDNLPSQARTRNSSSSVISCSVMSGSHVIICCSGDRSAFFLYSKSPKALARARLPVQIPQTAAMLELAHGDAPFTRPNDT